MTLLSNTAAVTESTALKMANALFAEGNNSDAIKRLSENLQDPACFERLREHFVAERRLDALQPLLQSRLGDPRIDTVNAAVRAHLQRNWKEAIEKCREVLQRHPTDKAAQNHLARALFNAGATDDSLTIFQQLTEQHPHYAEAWNGLGHILRDRGRPHDAERAFLRAVELMPAFAAALINLGIVQLAQTRPKDAEQIFTRLLEVNPDHAEGWLHLAGAQHLQRKHELARNAYLTAISKSVFPLAMAHRQLAKLYNETADTENAIKHFEAALAIEPDNPEIYAEQISVYELSNRLEEGWHYVCASLKRFPGHPILEYEAAKLERRLGRHAEGLLRLQRIDANKIPPHLRQWYFYELGTALDRAGQADKAYEAFVLSNNLARTGARARITDTAAFGRALDAMADWVTICAPMPNIEPDEDLGEDLCFLMGFPRSGTTLLDVMLDGHPDVICIEERQTMEIIFHEVDSTLGGFPHGLSNTTKEQRQQLRRHYRDLLARHIDGTSQGKRIIDKMPIRTPYAAFIARLFPAAKILFSVRHPCDVVLSNFMQHYAANEVFVHFYSLQESAETYAKVMTIWRLTVPHLPKDSFLYVRYESLIDDTVGTLQEVCKFLSLTWQEGLSEHQKNLSERERIRTNSYHQVAEPIYRRAAGRWLSYKAPFTALLPILKPHARFFDYDIE